MSFDYARLDEPSRPVADLLWATHVPMMSYLFGSAEVWADVVAQEWRVPESVLFHQTMTLAQDSQGPLGVMIGFAPGQFSTAFDDTCIRLGETLQGSARVQFQIAMTRIRRLFPRVREDDYYLFQLAVARRAQGTGLGHQLFDLARERAQNSGARRMCVDVAACNAACLFFRSLGMETDIETRVPFLDDTQQVGLHLHMSLTF